MAEGAEGAPVSARPLTTEQKQHLQGLATGVVLRGERSVGAAALSLEDQGRQRHAIDSLRTGDWVGSAKAMSEIAKTPGDAIDGLTHKLGEYGTNRDKDGKKLRPVGDPETQRHTKGAKELEKLKIYLEKGFENLKPAQQKEIRESIEKMVGRMPTFGAQFRDLSDDQRKTLIDQRLNDPRFVKYIIEETEKIKARTLTPEAEILKAQKERELSTHDAGAAGDTATQAEKDLLATRQALADLRANNVPMAPDIAAQIQNSYVNLSEAVVEQGKAEQELANLTAQRAAILATPGNKIDPLVAEVAIANNKINAAKAAQTQERNNIRTLNSQHLSNLPKDEAYVKRLAEQSEVEAKAKRIGVEKPLEAKEKGALADDLERKRAIEEDGVNRAMENIFANAFQRMTADELQASLTALEAHEPEMRAKIDEHAFAGFKKHLETRWEHEVPRNRGLLRRKGIDYVRNKKAIDRDYTQLLRSGPEDNIRSILAGLRPTRGGLEARLTTTEIDDLMKDPAFANTMSETYVTRLLANRIITKKIRPGEVNRITGSDWGKAMIDKAIATNADFRGNVERLAGDVDLDKTDFRSRFSRAAARHPGLLLFPLTTVPTLIGALIRANWEASHRAATNDPQDLEDQIAA